MSDKHPYVPATGYIVQTIARFRKTFPANVNAETLKKLGIAPKNESRIINIFRFLGLLDEEGNRTDDASKIFSINDDDIFTQEFSNLVLSAYKTLFALHGENTWKLSTNELITFFRYSDQSTAIVGKFQASTFQVLAAFSGHGEVPEYKSSNVKTASNKPKRASIKAIPFQTEKEISTERNETVKEYPSAQVDSRKKDLGLTVRIEINLPSDGDQDTYDRIFKSIRENLLEG